MSCGVENEPRATLLSRDTEKEGIIVTPGSCELLDPSFSSAAERLAGLEIEVQDPPLPSSSPSSSRSRGRASSLAAGSSRSLRTNSARSLASISEGRASFRSADSVEYEQQFEIPSTERGKSNALDSVSNGKELNYKSPFGCPVVQQELSEGCESLDSANDAARETAWGSKVSGQALPDGTSHSESSE